jgi:hypothetical protein
VPPPTPFQSSPAPAAARLESIVGGTLALLTHYARMPDLSLSDRIACNLALIARHPEASSALRSVCIGLFTDWLGPLQVQDAPAGADWRDVWPMPPATQ